MTEDGLTPRHSGSSSPGPMERSLHVVETGNRIYEALTGAIAAISAILAFVSQQGPINILVQIGIMGFALYFSLFVAVPVALGLLKVLHVTTRRESTEAATAVIVIAVLAACALLIRFGLFYDGIGQPGDLDGIGTTFCAAVGVITILIPFVVLWWHKGSTPRPLA